MNVSTIRYPYKYKRGEEMEYIILIIFVLFIISRMLPVKDVKNLAPEEIKHKLKNKDIQLIDVRTPGEYQNGHVKKFKNIPLQSLKDQSKQLKKDKEVVVICRSGNRSMRACRILKKQGFENLTNVRGGMNMWRG